MSEENYIYSLFAFLRQPAVIRAVASPPVRTAVPRESNWMTIPVSWLHSSPKQTVLRKRASEVAAASEHAVLRHRSLAPTKFPTRSATTAFTSTWERRLLRRNHGDSRPPRRPSGVNFSIQHCRTTKLKV